MGIVFYLKTAFTWFCGLEKTDDLNSQSIMIIPVIDEVLH
jgi:hypothetical protein